MDSQILEQNMWHFGFQKNHKQCDEVKLLIEDIRQTHRLRLVVELPLCTTGFIYIPQVVLAGFLKHQQYFRDPVSSGLDLLGVKIDDVWIARFQSCSK